MIHILTTLTTTRLVDSAGGHGVIDGLCIGTNPALPEPIAPRDRRDGRAVIFGGQRSVFR